MSIRRLRVVVVLAFLLIFLVPLSSVYAEGEAPPVPAAEEPAVEEPAAEEPAAEEPAAEEPAAEEPAAEEPAAEEPAAEEPAAEEPAAEEPAAEEPAAEEPAAEEPAGEEPAGEGPAAEEPAAEEPAGEEPAGEEPAVEEPSPEEGEVDLQEVVAAMAEEELVLEVCGEALPLASQEAADVLESLSEPILDLAQPAAVETIAQETGDNVTGNALELGQSFTSTKDGQIKSIEVASNTSGSSTLRIYNGVPSDSNAAAYTQAVMLVDTIGEATAAPAAITTAPPINTFYEIVLDTAFSVKNGQLYSFTLSNWSSAYRSADVYAGGSMHYYAPDAEAGTPDADVETMISSPPRWQTQPTMDLAFKVHIDDVPESPPTVEERLEAEFIPGVVPDYSSVPAGMTIMQTMAYMQNSGYVGFTIPEGYDPALFTILFWDGGSWVELPGVSIMGNWIQGLALTDGNYILVYNG